MRLNRFAVAAVLAASALALTGCDPEGSSSDASGSAPAATASAGGSATAAAPAASGSPKPSAHLVGGQQRVRHREVRQPAHVHPRVHARD
ncbi:hypothetical protein ABZ391_36430, partial [Kitasatospora cineracea]